LCPAKPERQQEAGKDTAIKDNPSGLVKLREKPGEPAQAPTQFGSLEEMEQAKLEDERDEQAE